MEVFSTKKELNSALATRSGVCGLVPTMGALHNGHLSLVTQCRRDCDTVVVSIFVNPTQFNDPGDLKNYPRTLEADLKLLNDSEADIVFAPSAEEMYPQKDDRKFDFGTLDRVMEGASRPGHFNGVAQVVSRLFDIVKPDKAFFGEKDFQQIAIIKEMVRQLHYAVQIVDCPIVRDADGLALSSRNTLLTPEHRAVSPLIFEALTEAAATIGQLTTEQVKQQVIRQIQSTPLLKVEYFEIVDARTLMPITEWSQTTPMRGCVAVQAGKVRLIDNVAF